MILFDTKFYFSSLHRDHWKDQLFLSSQYSEMPTIILLETVAHLMRPDLPWVCKVVDHLVRGKVFSLLREMVLFGMVCASSPFCTKHYFSLSYFQQIPVMWMLDLRRTSSVILTQLTILFL